MSADVDNEMKSIIKVIDYLGQLGFTKKRNTFFKFRDAGIILIVKLEQSSQYRYGISIDAQSMYSELSSHWFSDVGSYARYEIAELRQPYMQVLMKRRMSMNLKGSTLSSDDYRKVIEKIDLLTQLDSQESLISFKDYMDIDWFGSINWIDLSKYAPYLFISDYDNAALIIESIIDQHNKAAERNRMIMGKTFSLLEWEIEEMKHLEYLYGICRSRNDHVKETYLFDNLRRNEHFCRNII